jgi:poly(3-hydroxybutyrate) depolymerase
MPAFIVHGTADPLIWYQCGVQAQQFWETHNGCSPEVDVKPVKGGACEWSRGCADGGQVVFCHMDGMVHGWAGADGKDGGGTQYENISRVIWDFFESQ